MYQGVIDSSNWGARTVGKRTCRQGAWLLGILLCLSTAPAAEIAPTPDIRVLIDVSGSMRQTDPQNLRRPALRLLAGLLQDDMYAGVWTFGQYVNMQVPYGRADAAWQARALAESENIHSRALFTNIEAALATAAFDWHAPAAEFHRSLILLTDGMVDVSKNPAENLASQQRIINELLPRLQHAGVRIHTIALSDEADGDLMSQLAVTSGGWFERAHSAEDLQRIFLRLFEKSARPDSLPIDNNVFKVDDTVQDMTLLIFRQPQDPPLRLRTPDGQDWRADQHPATVRWHAESGYDLMSVNAPQAGEWRLDTQPDPDNRVMVLTNLRLRVSELPNHVLISDIQDVEAWLAQAQSVVSAPEVLEHVDFQLRLLAQDGSSLHKAVLRAEQHPDTVAGVYSAALSGALTTGEQTLLISANSPTFEREYRHRLKVHASPLELALQPGVAEQGMEFHLRVRSELFRPDSLQLSLQTATGQAVELQQVDATHWRADITNELAAEPLQISLTARRHGGEEYQLQMVYPLLAVEAASASDAPGVERTMLPGTGEAPLSVTPALSTGLEAEPDPANADSGNILWLVLGVNLLLMAGAIGGYLLWARHRARERAREQQEMAL